MSECQFCGRDPYHYVDIGVGFEAVAVTCCELGVELFDHRCTGDVTLTREEFQGLADQIRRNRVQSSMLDDAVVALQGILEHPGDKESWDDAKAAMPRLLEAIGDPPQTPTAEPQEEPDV
jgi:hypothetical protein